jgi:hypothetical protein
MRNVRRYQLDELILSPGTYFNPQTEIMVVVDDSPEVDHELFEAGDFEAAEWVQISDEAPLDEPKRDGLVESFVLAHQPGSDTGEDDELDDLEEDDLDEDEEEEDLEEDDDGDALDDADEDGLDHRP